ncbi:20504_t:CDS:2, partial [Rhizophagus irregularis]
QTGETAIFTNTGRPMYFLLDKHRLSSEKTQEINNLSIRTSKTTISLDNAVGEKSYIPSNSINNFLKERPSEGKEDCIWNVIDRSPKNQTKDAEFSTRFQLKELVHIKRFAKLYCITNFCPVLSCHDSIFWLKDPDGVIYIWSRIDGMMIRGGCDMKEALSNFLFHEENLYYIEDYTLELIPVKKAKEEAKKWCEENKNTTTKFVITDELLKPLEKKKEGSNKSGKQKK